MEQLLSHHSRCLKANRRDRLVISSHALHAAFVFLQMMAYLTDDPWDTEIDTGVSQGAVSGKGGRQSGGGSGEGSEDEGRSEMGSAGRAMRGSEATGSGRVRGGNVGAGAGASASAGAGGRGRGERGVGGNGREGSYVSRSRSPMGRDGSPSKRPRSPVSFDQSRSSSFENGVGVGMGWEDPLGGVALDLNDAAPWEKRGEGTGEIHGEGGGVV